MGIGNIPFVICAAPGNATGAGCTYVKEVCVVIKCGVLYKMMHCASMMDLTSGCMVVCWDLDMMGL